MRNVIYKEHLSIFCRVLHVEIHMNIILHILEGKTLLNSDKKYIDYLREDCTDNPETLNACYQKNSSVSTHSLSECNIVFNKPELDMTPKDTEIYLIDLNSQGNDSSDDLSFFIKDCQYTKKYYIILNFNDRYVKESKRKVIFDQSNCDVKLLVTIRNFKMTLLLFG